MGGRAFWEQRVHGGVFGRETSGGKATEYTPSVGLGKVKRKEKKHPYSWTYFGLNRPRSYQYSSCSSHGRQPRGGSPVHRPVHVPGQKSRTQLVGDWATTRHHPSRQVNIRDPIPGTGPKCREPPRLEARAQASRHHHPPNPGRPTTRRNSSAENNRTDRRLMLAPSLSRRQARTFGGLLPVVMHHLSLVEHILAPFISRLGSSSDLARPQRCDPD